MRYDRTLHMIREAIYTNRFIGEKVSREDAAPLSAPHILWMADQVDEHADDWDEGKLGRWIGYMLAACERMHLFTNDQAQRIVRADVDDYPTTSAPKGLWPMCFHRFPRPTLDNDSECVYCRARLRIATPSFAYIILPPV